MNIWGCNCEGDPVGDASQEVVEAILARKKKEEQKTALQQGQERLVKRIYESCWPKGDGETSWASAEVIWVNTYVQLAGELARHLEEKSPEDVSTHSFFYHPAGIAVDHDEAVRLHDDVLIKRLENESIIPWHQRPTHWISYKLANLSYPPIVRIWLEEGTLKSDPDIGPVHELYECLFADQKHGVYMHVAYPGRTTRLNQYVAQAGSYLFLKNEHAFQRKPRCLVFHLRAFVQALVTAQLWALSQHLHEREISILEELKKHSRVFSANRGNLLNFLNAAKGIQGIVDHLAIDCSALESAKVLSNSIFDRKNLYHRYSQIVSLSDGDPLDNMLKKYFIKIAYDTPKDPSQASITNLICEAAQKLSSLADRWCLAHACYRGNISLSLLTVSYLDLGLELISCADPNEGEQSTETSHWQICAATQLALWKIAGYVFSFDQRNRNLSILPNENFGTWENLKPKIGDWWLATRVRGDLGGDLSEPWARVLRGLAGPVENVHEWLDKIHVDNQCLIVPVRVDDEKGK